jgi:hypothetical protein
MVRYWFTVLNNAILASFDAIGQKPGSIAFSITGIVIGVGVVYGRKGVEAMKADILRSAFEVIAIAVLAWLPFFMWHLARTPFVLHEAQRLKAAQVPLLEQQLRDAKQAAPVRPDQEAEQLRAQIRVLERNARTVHAAPESSPQLIKLVADIRKALKFPEAVQDTPAAKAIIETVLVDQTPRTLFGVLTRYDENLIASVPMNGSAMQDFFRKYYEFQSNSVQLENDVLGRIGGIVAVKFRAGWLIYLRYCVFRFAGLSKDQIIAGGDFLNYDITWVDAERVYAALMADNPISQRFANLFLQHKNFRDFTSKAKTGL